MEAFNRYKQFIVYRLQTSQTRTDKLDKIPLNHQSLLPASAVDPMNWITRREADERIKQLGVGYGVGFVFTATDPFFFLDIDNCYDGIQWSELATKLLGLFHGAAVEVSSSGKGLHIFGSGHVPPHSCTDKANGLELYTSGRFAALTGSYAAGDASLDCTQTLRWLVETHFPLSSAPGTLGTGWTDEPCAEWNGTEDDEKLIDRMLRSQPASVKLGKQGVTFRDLWEANADILARHYPSSQPNSAYDESAADAALAQRLAFWTGNHCERMRRLMWRSALARSKWEREDYLPRTIEGACGRQKEWLRDTVTATNNTRVQTETPRPERIVGNTYLSVDEQEVYFGGCVYVQDEHKVMVPGGYLLTPERFKAMYGGRSFVMDNSNERVIRNAFEAFTESQALRAPRADTTCFRPGKAPGGIIEVDGQYLANIYHPVKTPRKKGDVTLFKRHCDRLFGETEDQLIMVSYMAAVIQYPGIKFQWCPLIQGVEGNGKTFFTRCVAFAIGARYSHFPKASEIASRFNDWNYAKLFIGVEDIYYDARHEIIEILKPMITNERQEVEGKGVAKVTKDICSNFILNTNHKDGLRKKRNDRRFAPFFTRQQSVDDLKRDRMDGDYFLYLYRWAMKDEGYAVISEYLHTFDIPDRYNPTTLCMRAPITDSTEAAISSGIGRIEQEILEAIERGDMGFRGGFVSSHYLDKLLIEIKAGYLSHRKRKDLMNELGYDWHPGLKEGRLNNVVLPDGSKSRLYVKEDHPSIRWKEGARIAEAYTREQTQS